MFDAAILGAGPIGAAVAHRLAERGRLHRILMVDREADVAAGIALDIQQSGPVSGFETRLSATSEILAAAAADVVVLADQSGDVAWDHDEGLAAVERLLRAGAMGPLVFAGPTQHRLMEACYRDLEVSRDRLVGTAPSALIGAVRSLVGLELDVSSVELVLVGRPPAFVVGWTAATVGGTLVSERLAAHHLLAISHAVPRLWPPGPRAIGSATAPVVEALRFGSHRLHAALTILDGELGARGVAVMLPLELGHGRVQARIIPSLSDQERTALMNGLAR
jgi:malate dehydrogenase